MERLRTEGAELVYRCAKQSIEPSSDKQGAKVDELHLTPLELIGRIAGPDPPPHPRRAAQRFGRTVVIRRWVRVSRALRDGPARVAGESRLAPESHAIGPLRLHISDRFKAAWTHKTSDMLVLV